MLLTSGYQWTGLGIGKIQHARPTPLPAALKTNYGFTTCSVTRSGNLLSSSASSASLLVAGVCVKLWFLRPSARLSLLQHRSP